MNPGTRLLVLVVLMLAAPALAQPVSPCKPDDGGILVCPNGKSELRIIRGTPSPSKRYAIAWKTDEGTTGKDYEAIERDGYTARFAGDDVPTFLVRLTDGKVLTKLKGEHLGDQENYNHRSAAAIWSAKETWMVAVHDNKWETDSANAFRIGADGVPEALDLLPLCRTAEQNYFKHTRQKIDLDNFAQSISVKSVGDNGVVGARCSIQVIKQDDYYSFAAKIKLSAAAKGVTAKILSVKLCKDNDKGDCAS